VVRVKRKVGTTLDAKLYQEIKEIARRQGRSTNAVIEDALSRFLASRISTASVVAETKGTFSVPAKAVQAVLHEDLYGTA
jgi:hypothetical protein